MINVQWCWLLHSLSCQITRKGTSLPNDIQICVSWRQHGTASELIDQTLRGQEAPNHQSSPRDTYSMKRIQCGFISYPGKWKKSLGWLPRIPSPIASTLPSLCQWTPWSPLTQTKICIILTLLSYVCICICVCTCICCCQWTLIYPLNTQCFNIWILIIIISIHYQFEFSNSSPLLCPPGCSLWSHFAAIGFLGWKIRTLAVPLLTNLPHNGSFLAVQDSSIGDLVTQWVSESSFDFSTFRALVDTSRH